MKTIVQSRVLAAFSAAIMAAASLHAAPVIYEPFADSNASLTGNTPGTGLTGTWAVNEATWSVGSPGFSFGKLAFSGNRANKTSSRGANSITTGTVSSNSLKNAGLLNDGATLWFSFLWKMDDAAVGNGDAGFALGTQTLTGPNSIPMASSGNGIGVSLETWHGYLWASTWSSATRSNGTQYSGFNRTTPRLVLGKIVWGADATSNDTVSIYLPSTDLVVPASPVSTKLAVLDQSLFNVISFASKNEGSPAIDEIRFGATSDDVLPVDTVAPSLVSITDNMAGGPIGEDVAEVTYTLTFDKHMDISTITDADFANAGTATATVGTPTQVSPAVITVKLLPTTTGTVQLRIPATSVLKSLAQVDLDTTADILDDAITINSSTTPANTPTTNRWWDGPATGITNGASAGGTGTWSTTNTSWDRGVGFEGPVGWVNAAGTPKHDAVLGGTAATVTLGEEISLRNLTFTHTASTYTITGSTLNFTSGTITASNPPNTSTVNAIIRPNITGSPALNLKPMDGDDQFTLNPVASGSMSIGAVSGDAGDSSEKLNLQGGAGSTGTITSVTGAKVLVSAGLWTLSGASTGRNHEVSAGTLTLNANLTSTSRAVILSGLGVLNYNVASAVSASPATASSVDNGFRITGGTLDQTSGAAINTNASAQTIDLAGTLTFAGTNGALSNLNLGTGAVFLKGGNRQVTVTDEFTTLSIGGVIQNDSTPGRGLTKAGAGTLELRGANTYTGATAVNGGKLLVTTGSLTRCTSAVTVADTAGCVFGVKLAAANGQWASSSSLTVSGTNSQIEVDYNGTDPSTSTSEDPIKVTDLTVSGAGTLKVLGVTPSTPVGTYPLINFTGTGPAEANPYTGLTLSLPVGVTGKLTTTANHVNLVIGGGTTYTVTYDHNDSTSGTVPVDGSSPYATAATVTVLANTGSLVKTDFVFTGWNTQADGLGTHYNPAATFPMASANVTLYADWKGPYQIWAGAAAFDADANGDGVDNGLAWLLGAPDKDVSALALLPKVTENSGELVLEFTCLKVPNRGGAALKLQYSKDLGMSDLWTSHEVAVPDAAGTVGSVTFTVPSTNPDPNLVNLKATIPASAAAPGGKLFARLKGEQ